MVEPEELDVCEIAFGVERVGFEVFIGLSPNFVFFLRVAKELVKILLSHEIWVMWVVDVLGLHFVEVA